MNDMWVIEDTMMDDSGQKHIQDATTLNSKSMHWLGHIMILSTGTSSALGACQLHIGTHYTGMA